MTVNGLLRSISSSELTEWQAYFKIKNELLNPKPNVPNTGEILKSMYAHKVVRKK